MAMVLGGCCCNFFITSQQNKEIKCFKKRTILSKGPEASPEA
jgi:hypothetical protein